MNNKTTHEDMIELDGFWAYEIQSNSKAYDVGTEITLRSGHVFIINNIKNDSDSGLNAITLTNKDTGEVVVIFVGTVGITDMIQDGLLVTNITPPQYEAGEAYLREMQDRYGNIAYCGGNSLGGGVGSYAGGKTGVAVVNLNPAPVPGNMGPVDSSEIYNYIVGNDPLFSAVEAAGMGDRIIGQNVMLPPGLYANRVLNNHLGDYKDVKVGDETKILYSTATFIPFSIWHKDKIISGGDYGGRVDINSENMELLGMALGQHSLILDAVIKHEFNEAKKELSDFQGRLETRKQEVQEYMKTVLNEVFDPIIRLIETLKNNYYRYRKATIRNLSSSNKAVGMILDVIFKPLDSYLEKLEKYINKLIDLTYETIIDTLTKTACKTLFANQDTETSIPNQLIKQHKKINKNIKLVNKRCKYVGTSSKNLALAFKSLDENMASSIASNTCQADVFPMPNVEWPSGEIEELASSYSKQMRDKVKEKTTQRANKEVVTVVNSLVGMLAKPINVSLVKLDFQLEGMEYIYKGATVATTAAFRTIDKMDIFNLTEDALEKSADKIDQSYRDFKVFSDELQMSIRSINIGLMNIDSVIEKLMPYFVESLMSNSVLESVNSKYAITQQALTLSKETFGEIAYQFQNHQAKAVDLLGDKSKIIQSDFKEVSDSIEKLIL